MRSEGGAGMAIRAEARAALARGLLERVRFFSRSFSLALLPEVLVSVLPLTRDGIFLVCLVIASRHAFLALYPYHITVVCRPTVPTLYVMWSYSAFYLH
jgi:hypothetical protein